MSTYGHAYKCIDVERELNGLMDMSLHDQSVDGLVYIFGMHMAFDEEYSKRLENAIKAFGWKIAERELSTLHERMDADERALELCVDAAEHYGNVLKCKLAAIWLSQD